MISDIKKNKLDYIVLASVSVVYLFIFFSNRTDGNKNFQVTILFSAFYLIWGIVHHLKDKTLKFRIVLEYFLVSILAVLIASSLLL